MSLKALLFGAKTAAENLKAIEARLAQLEADESRLAGEKQATELALDAAILADATGETTLPEGQFSKLRAAVAVAEEKRLRVERTAAALRSQLPAARLAVNEEAAAGILARLKPVNADIGKTAGQLAAAVRKVRELADRMTAGYEQSSALQREYEGLAGEVPVEAYPYPHEGFFSRWRKALGFGLNDDEIDFLAETPEREAARRTEEAEQNRQREEANRANTEKERAAVTMPGLQQFPHLNPGEEYATRGASFARG